MNCPKCKQPAQVIVTMTVSGYLGAEATIEDYPELEGECAEPTDSAWCMECEHTATLEEFK